MPTTESIAQPTVQHIRAVNRAAEIRAGIVQNVIERLEVYGVLASHAAIHPKVTRDHAERIVDAVIGLSGGHR